MINLARPIIVRLTRFLQDEGYEVTTAASLADARKNLANPTLVLLDWKLPDGQGIDYLRELRAEKNPVPIIMLTARAELLDKVLGLEMGASDYLTKPFEPRELLARIRVQLRVFSEPASSALLHAGAVVVDREARQIRFKGVVIETTKIEFDLVKLFVEHENRVFSRDELLNRVWGYDQYPTTRTVDTHILQLRHKLSESYIETVRGCGYRWVTGKELT